MRLGIFVRSAVVACACTAAFSSPAGAATYAFDTDFSAPIVVPQFDPTKERVQGFAVQLGGIVHYEIRQFGFGLERDSPVEVFAMDDYATYVATASIAGLQVGAYGVADGNSISNNYGALGTYVLYSYDTEIVGNQFYSDALDEGALAIYSQFYRGPTTFAFKLDSYYQINYGGEFSDPRVAGRLVFYTTSVPEPATWAMMLMGFGMVGAGLRRRAKARMTISFAGREAKDFPAPC